MATVAARRLAVDRNPLWTWAERFRTWVTIAAAVLVVLAAPLAARAAMDLARPVAVHDAQARAAQVHRVSAVLLDDAVPVTYTVGETGPARVPARWTGPDGRVHRQTIDVTRRMAAGQRMAIWVDGQGRPSPAPLTPSQIDGRVAAMGAVAGFGTLVVIGLPAWLFRRWVDRRESARWELQWAVLAPRWNRKY